MKLTIRQISQIIDAQCIGNGDPDHTIDTLLTDSRDLTYPDKTLFLAIRTNVNDGHRYIGELYDQGVRYFVVNEDAQALAERYPGSMMLYVSDVLAALQALGTYARNSHNGLTVIGITGSRGKTVVKELLYQMLATHYNVVRSPRSYNSQIGVPLSLWQIDDSTDIAIIEAGISQPGEMLRLKQMIQPDICAITSLTDEHADGFECMEQKCAEKVILVSGCRDAYVKLDGENHGMIVSQLYELCDYVTNTNGGNIGLAKAIATTIDRRLSGGRCAAQINSMTYNDQISSRIDVTETLKNCLIVFDSFTNDYRSIYDALNYTCRHLTPGRTLTLILTEPSLPIDAAQLSQLMTAKGVTRVIAIGNALRGIDVPTAQVKVLDTVDELLARYSISDFNNEVILVKGQPGSGAEDIKALLEAPRHETVMEVDLGAITRNFNFFRSRIQPETGIVAMVKAAGYGVGAIELAKTMQNQGARYLAVAVIDEGVELRRNGITMPIIVMNPIGTNYKALFENRLEPSVFSIRELKLLTDNAQRLGIEDYPVHIKLDTGMHRLGFLPDELTELTDVLLHQRQVRVQSIFSHLATADCLDQDEYTQMQLDAFEAMSTRIMDALPYRSLRHILNTAGILRYPQYQYDMVRLGIGLYGVAPIDGYKLAPVARLLSTIISIKEYNEPVTIGYGRRGVVNDPRVIATVPIGYADGLNRHLSNGNAYMLVNGHRCNIIGNICMDQCMIDITGADARIGDTVEIFGAEAPIERLSQTLDTIPYEILTSVSPRVKRIYFRD